MNFEKSFIFRVISFRGRHMFGGIVLHKHTFLVLLSNTRNFVVSVQRTSVPVFVHAKTQIFSQRSANSLNSK